MRVRWTFGFVVFTTMIGCSSDKLHEKPIAAAGSGAAGTAAAAAGATANSAGAAAPRAGTSGTIPPLGGAGAIAAAGVGAAGAGLAGAPSSGAAGTGAPGTGLAGAPSSDAAGASGTGASGTGAAGTGAGSGGMGGTEITAAACSGKPGSKRGKSTESVMAGGRRRTFVYYAPEKLDANKPVPLLIVPHGYTQSGEAMFDITKYPMIADREGFVAVFPDGAPGSVGPWDVGTGVCGNGALVPGSGDDQAFIDEMIKFASDDQCIDRDHIFMSGWSMGGYLSNHSGCLRSDIRAIGPHSAGTHDLSGCKTQRKPVILFHFDPDGLIDYSCGVRARDGWVKRNGCSMDSPDVTMVKGGKCEYYKGCPADGQVAFCTFDIPPNHTADFLAGHAWSGGTVRAYSVAETESAAELGWAFFKKYAW